VADLPVGQHLQDQPFYYNAYALKSEALDTRPAVGALLWIPSSEARGDELDLHIAVTHLLPPEYSPTGGAITLSVAVVKPESRGTLTLRSRDPREQPEIDCNFLAEEMDTRRMLEGVKLARRIGAIRRSLSLSSSRSCPVRRSGMISSQKSSRRTWPPTGIRPLPHRWAGPMIRGPSSTPMVLSSNPPGCASSTHRSCRSFHRSR
jgi:hypothetical protein